MNYGFKKDARFCIASIGRCGSTMMTQFLQKNTSEGEIFGVHARDFVEFKGKVIFLFGNPIDTVISTHKEIFPYNLKTHYEHMNGDYGKRYNFMTEDSLGIEKLFDDWYGPHNFELITVRYETMWDNLDKLQEFFGISFNLFPPKKRRKTNWRKHKHKVLLRKTYERIYSKIESAEDIKIW